MNTSILHKYSINITQILHARQPSYRCTFFEPGIPQTQCCPTELHAYKCAPPIPPQLIYCLCDCPKPTARPKTAQCSEEETDRAACSCLSTFAGTAEPVVLLVTSRSGAQRAIGTAVSCTHTDTWTGLEASRMAEGGLPTRVHLTPLYAGGFPTNFLISL